MTTIRMFFLSLICTQLCSLTLTAHNFTTDPLQIWKTSYLEAMTPQQLQLTANILYLLYAGSLIELKIRQFTTPLSRLMQTVRTNIAAYKETNNELATLKTLIERLSYITGARTIYHHTLTTCFNYDQKEHLIDRALESMQLHAQTTLRTWAQENSHEMIQLLKKSSADISQNAQYFHVAAGLHKELSEGKMPIALPQEDEEYKSVIALDIILKSNHELLLATDNVINTINETSDHAQQLLQASADLYKQYYTIIYELIMSSSCNKTHATVLFSMHGLLPDEYSSQLPNPDRVFEHVLKTTKLYTQADFIQQ